MEIEGKDWQDKLDQFLLPQGVLFTRKAITLEFITEIRKLVQSARLPLFTAMLLRDGLGSWVFRTLSLVITIGYLALLVLAKPERTTAFIFLIMCATLAAPGWWMWSYCLLPLEAKMESMMQLFYNEQARANKKILKGE